MLSLRSLTLIAVLSGLVPGVAHAGGFGHKGGSGHGSKSSGSSGGSHPAAPVGTPHAAVPNGARGYSYAPGYSHGYYGYGYGAGGYRYYEPHYYSPAYYYGWGIHPWGYYGYGYYPYYGGPVVAEQVAPAPPSVTASIFLGGMVSHDGPGLDLRGLVEGQRVGVNFDLATVPTTNTDGTFAALPYLTGHLTYSFISDLHVRVRAEGGVSVISAPGVSYVGPDIGVSGQVALVGPLGVDANVHWTPIPANILDADAGLALHFGNLGIRGGWRFMRLDDRRVNSDGGVDLVNGPSLSVGLVF
jgi:hypothetical protein